MSDDGFVVPDLDGTETAFDSKGYPLCPTCLMRAADHTEEIKRELEEFANDGPVGPMVPYRLEAGTREDDLFALLVALTDLIETLVRLRRDVDDAYGRLRGLVF